MIFLEAKGFQPNPFRMGDRKRRLWLAYHPVGRRGRGGGLSAIVIPLRALRRMSRVRGRVPRRLLNERRHIQRSGKRLIERARPMVRLVQ